VSDPRFPQLTAQTRAGANRRRNVCRGRRQARCSL